jgi:putative flippase GtrA
VGFAVDATLLAVLVRAKVDPFAARLVSLSVATLVTWRLNRRLTFGASERPQGAEALRYGTVAALASTLNYLIYAAALFVAPSLPPLAAAVAATLATMAFSYLGYARFVFQSAPSFASPRSQSR